MDNSAAKDTLEKSWVHNHFVKHFYLQIKVKCRTTSGKIALCTVKHIYEKNKQIHLHINIYYKIKIPFFNV